jgi:hypothetical protein
MQQLSNNPTPSPAIPRAPENIPGISQKKKARRIAIQQKTAFRKTPPVVLHTMCLVNRITATWTLAGIFFGELPDHYTKGVPLATKR